MRSEASIKQRREYARKRSAQLYKENPEKQKETMARYRQGSAYLGRKQERAAYSKDYMKGWRASRKEWYDGIKLSRGCSRCGYNEFAIALEFHHRDPLLKTKAVSKMLPDGASYEEMEFEMSKCDLLCANCHRAIHYLQKQASACVNNE